MDNKYILSIDNGLTTTKVVLFSVQGKEIISCIKSTEKDTEGEFTEIDMDRQWENTVKAIKSCIDNSKINPKSIIGIGNTGHGNGIYMVDNTGKTIRKAVSSMDGRSYKIIQSWNKKGISNYKLTYQNLWNGQPIPILRWLKENESNSYNSIHKIMFAKDWIKYKLTDRICTDYTDSSGCGILDINIKDYNREVFRPFGLECIYERLPELTKSTDIIGYVSRKAAEETGLELGTPVIGGMTDVVACTLGNGVYDNKKYSIIAGTFSVNSAINNSLIPSKDILIWSLFADNRYYCQEASPNSAGNLDWFVKNIIKVFSNDKNTDIYKNINEKIKIYKASDVEIIYTPFLYRSKLTKNLAGSFLNIKGSHNIYHLIRAMYEGIVFAHKMHIDNLIKSGINRKQANISGGAANSDLWCQMFADILNMKIITTETSQEGALGVAIGVANALGYYSSFKEAINIMVKEKRHYYPDKKNHQIYMRKYKMFKDIVNLFDKEGEYICR